MRPLLVACLLGAAGCSTEVPVLYLPDATTVVPLAGYPAARYEIPPEAPRGSVRVASFGVTWVDASGFGPVRAVHARLLVENRDDAGPWDLDARALQAIFPGVGAVPAAAVNADGALPVLQVPPGREASLDAYFLGPLPRGESGVPTFDVAWTLKTPAGPVAGRTRFERRVLDLGPGTTVRLGYALGFSPSWWLDPRFFPPGAAGTRPPRVHLGYPGTT